MEDVQKLIGNQLRDLRKSRGLSQEELGWKAKLHYTYIGAIERGEKNVSINTLSKMPKALGISVNEIFNVPPDIKDPDKLKASMLKEIEKANPEILMVALELLKELNALKRKLNFRKRSKPL